MTTARPFTTYTTTSDWRPIFDDCVAVAPVAPDARPMIERRDIFTRSVTAMRIDPLHIVDVIEALELCERTHGAGVVTRALPFVEVLVSVATTALRVNLSHIAHLRGYHRPELWIGALIEREGGVAEHHRLFQHIAINEHWASPALEVDDVERACRLMHTLGVLEPFHTQRGVAYTYLVCAFRREEGAASAARLTGIAEQCANGQDAADAQPTKTQTAQTRFARCIDTWKLEHLCLVSAQWAQYAKGLVPESV